MTILGGVGVPTGEKLDGVCRIRRMYIPSWLLRPDMRAWGGLVRRLETTSRISPDTDSSGMMEEELDFITFRKHLAISTGAGGGKWLRGLVPNAEGRKNRRDFRLSLVASYIHDDMAKATYAIQTDRQ